jgi:outer membrane protein assembly factor BamB
VKMKHQPFLSMNLSSFDVRLGLLLIVFALGGCASSDESTPDWAGVKGDLEPAKLINITEMAKFEVRWHASTGDSGAEYLQPALTNDELYSGPSTGSLSSAGVSGTEYLQPALTSDAVYSASSKGSLIRWERATGKQVWRIHAGITASGGVGVGEGLVLVGGKKGDVLAYGEDGKLKWRSLVSSEVLNVSQVVDGVVVVRSDDGRIVGLSAIDGKRIWVYEHSTPALVVRSNAGVAIQRGVAYAGFAAGRLAAISIKDGEVLWENSVSQPRGNTELERISDITSDPVVDDEQVCAIAFQGHVACFDPAQGSPLWNRDISSDKGMMLLRKYLYLTDAGGYVVALDKTTGSSVWKDGWLLMRRVTAPYAFGDFVAVGDYEGYLHGLSREDGSILARIKLEGGAIVTAPIGMDGGVLVQTRGGELYSLSLH